MNKLVSKNPVQRFKLGNRIIKAAGGIKTFAPVNETIGRYVREKNRSLFGSGWRWYDTQAPVGRDHVALDQEVEQNGWILKPDGSKIKASLRNRQYQAVPFTTPKPVQTNTEIQQTTPTAKTNNEKIPIAQKTKQKTISISTKNPIQRKTSTTSKKATTPKSITEQDVINANQRKTPVRKPVLKTKNTNSISFKTAFNNARNVGQETFNWRGQSYNTRDKGEENYVFQNGKWVNPISNITFQAPELQSERIEVPLTASVTSPAVIIPEKITAPQITYNRTGIRQLIRDRGFNPYQFSGAQRRALRMVLNGQGTDTDRAIVSGMGIFKKGGLISKNPIQRFKLNK